jgi:hypothetical protein
MFIAKSKPNVTISAVITRADGTVEDLGVIASTKQGNVFTKFIKKIFKK